MLNQGQVFKALRESAGLSQRALAEKLSVDQSRVSRVEAGTADPTSEEATGWFGAAASGDAARAKLWLDTDWEPLPEVPPEWTHPDLAVLAKIARTLKQFKNVESVQEIAPQLRSYKTELTRIAAAIRNLSYRTALIGGSAVGKSTAESRGLELKTSSGGLVLPTGAGYTTLCESQIERGDHCGIIIDAEPHEEVRRLVEDMCAAQKAKASPSVEERPAIANEARAAILNMAVLAPKTVIGEGGAPVRTEPLADLVAHEGERAVGTVLIRMNLLARTKTELRWEPGNGEQYEWLRINLRKVNKGLDPEAPLPRRIRVVLPRAIFPDTAFDVTVIDTRGVVDEIVRRPDLAEALSDVRTIPVLCSKFPNAPDLYARHLLKYAAQQEFIRWDTRVGILLLAQGDEATKVTHEDTDDFVATAQEGILIKQAQARQQLEPKASNVAIATYDAMKDPPQVFREFILGRIEALRAMDVDRAGAVVQAAGRLIDNSQQGSLLVAQRIVSKEVLVALNKVCEIDVANQQPSRDVLREVASAHARSVWAMTRRQGVWRTLSLDLHMSDGAADIARKRSRPAVDALASRLGELKNTADGQLAADFVQQLVDAIDACRVAFVEKARVIVAATVWGPMNADLKLWFDCESEWGQGAGFRDRVVGQLSAWLQKNSSFEDDFRGRIVSAWNETFMTPLAQLCEDHVEEVG